MAEITLEMAKERAKAARQAAVDALVAAHRPWGMADSEFFMDRVRREAERNVEIVLTAWFDALGVSTTREGDTDAD